jgi:hypothetical protein
MNPIQKVIEESNKEFEEKKHKLITSNGLSLLMDYPPHDQVLDENAVKSFISQRDQKILSAIETEVGEMKKDETSIYGQVTGEPKQYNSALSEVQELLKSAKETIK